MCADADGGGKMGLIGFDANVIKVALSTGSGFDTPKNVLTEFGAAGCATDGRPPLFAADINGDGLADQTASASAPMACTSPSSAAHKTASYKRRTSYIGNVGVQLNTTD